MRYETTLEVTQIEADSLEAICLNPHSDVKKEGVEFDREVTFENGNRMAIQVCGPTQPDIEPCWTQGVVFHEGGTELGCTDVGESFLGEYHVPVGTDEYVVNIYGSGTKEQIVASLQRLTELIISTDEDNLSDTEIEENVLVLEIDK